jgi:branched-chain amino acid transport system ATP-binding protein
MSKELLRIKDLNAWYGESHILHGVNLTVNEGEVVTLLGRNGAGRTTTLRAIVGMTGARKGSIRINGEEAIRLAPHKVARLGVGYCPEERGIFASLSAEENLMLPPAIAPGGMSIAEIYAMFPNLKERANSPGTRLSGGEQQMLAVARILRTGARLLLLDEISEGLAPVIVLLCHGTRPNRQTVCARSAVPKHGHAAGVFGGLGGSRCRPRFCFPSSS